MSFDDGDKDRFKYKRILTQNLRQYCKQIFTQDPTNYSPLKIHRGKKFTVILFAVTLDVLHEYNLDYKCSIEFSLYVFPKIL